MAQDKMKDYLGDGVYVEWDGWAIVLKANNPDEPTDTIYLEPRVWEALKRYAKRVGIEGELLEG